MTEKQFVAKGLIEGISPIWWNDQIMEQKDVAQLLNELKNKNEFYLKIIKFIAETPVTKYESVQELIEEMTMLEEMGVI